MNDTLATAPKPKARVKRPIKPSNPLRLFSPTGLPLLAVLSHKCYGLARRVPGTPTVDNGLRFISQQQILMQRWRDAFAPERTVSELTADLGVALRAHLNQREIVSAGGLKGFVELCEQMHVQARQKEHERLTLAGAATDGFALRAYAKGEYLNMLENALRERLPECLTVEDDGPAPAPAPAAPAPASLPVPLDELIDDELLPLPDYEEPAADDDDFLPPSDIEYPL